MHGTHPIDKSASANSSPGEPFCFLTPKVLYNPAFLLWERREAHSVRVGRVTPVFAGDEAPDFCGDRSVYGGLLEMGGKGSHRRDYGVLALERPKKGIEISVLGTVYPYFGWKDDVCRGSD